MYYPIAIEPGCNTNAFGVVVPDLPDLQSGESSVPGPFASLEQYN